MQKLAILIMSDGTNTIDIIGTQDAVYMYESAIKISVKSYDDMWKKIKIAYNKLIEQGFIEIHSTVKQYV